MGADVCDFNVHSFTEEEHSIARTKCSLCGQCVEVCSNNALKIYGKEYSVDEILDIVLKDKVYYIESNGGVTLSGGEPLQQFKFVMELFQKLKTESIHTCLDTTGFTNESIMEHIIPWTDLFLFDYKLSDSEQYCLHTKMNMDTILRNLKLLNFHGKRVILRCPIIPGINDNIKHVDSIIDLASYNENISQIDVIPYHRMGESKYNHVNRSRNYRAEINYAIPLERIKNRLRTHLTVPVNLSKESTRA